MKFKLEKITNRLLKNEIPLKFRICWWWAQNYIYRFLGEKLNTNYWKCDHGESSYSVSLPYDETPCILDTVTVENQNKKSVLI